MSTRLLQSGKAVRLRRETCRAEAPPGRGWGRAGQWGACRALSGPGRPWEGLPQGAPSAAMCGCARQRCQDSAQRASSPGPRTPLTQAVLWAPTRMEDHPRMEEGLDDHSSVLIPLPWLPRHIPPPCPSHHFCCISFLFNSTGRKARLLGLALKACVAHHHCSPAPPCLLKAPLQPCAPKKCSLSPPQRRSLPSSSLSTSWR